MLVQQDLKLVKIQYNKDFGEYVLIYEVNSTELSFKELKQYLIKDLKKWDATIIEDQGLIYLVKNFQKEEFEEDYPFLVEDARVGSLPERIDPELANKEYDLLNTENEGAWLLNLCLDHFYKKN